MREQQPAVYPPQCEEEAPTKREADHSQENPMLRHPHDELHIPLVPTTTHVMREKTPSMFRIFIRK